VNRLAEIVAAKRLEIAEGKKQRSLAALQEEIAHQAAPRGFEAALRRAADRGLALIAEIKRASPSRGTIREDFRPADHAKAYEDGGAACLSVLTDRQFFQGSADDLETARAASTLPVLRKDFLCDPWQVAEARAMGADAILLIVAMLDDAALLDLATVARELGMDVLVEAHDEGELDRALLSGARLIGVNNRDLTSFVTDLSVTERLAAHVPDDVLLASESGITSRVDLVRLHETGARAFLVGEHLMRQHDLAAATKALLNG
jgi:indole-3-glycerol phosphate synthase